MVFRVLCFLFLARRNLYFYSSISNDLYFTMTAFMKESGTTERKKSNRHHEF